jgi:hypothetical protein
MIPGLTEEENYDRNVRGLKTQVQGEVTVRDLKTFEEAMLIAERYDAMLFPSRGRCNGTHDSDTGVHHVVVPRKHAYAMDVDAITRIEQVPHVNLRDAECDILWRESRFSKVARSDIWHESVRSTLLKKKLARKINTQEQVLPVNYPGRPPDLLNQELESDLDAPRIILLDLNVAQQDNRRNLLILGVELDGKPVNALEDSGVQRCFISE